MRTSSKGMELIKSFEGLRLTAYQCSAEIWTIGYGHTGKVDQEVIRKGMRIKKDKADELLKCDLIRFEKYVMKYVPQELNQNQFDALVSFTFNCGPLNLQRLVKNRSLQEIAAELIRYNKAGGKTLAGLTRRRKEEQKLYNTL